MNKLHQLPKGLISTTQFAKIMGGDWDADKVRRLFRKTGCGFQLKNKDGTRTAWFTTRTRIRELSMELFEELTDVEDF